MSLLDVDHARNAPVPLLLNAWLSDCGTYRYTLRRQLHADDGHHARSSPRWLAWVMLNPSTADATKNDPTIRKVLGFTERTGHSAIYVVNLFAFRATRPSQLRAAAREHGASYAEGPRNRDAIAAVADVCTDIVCAWGAEPFAQERGRAALDFLRSLGKPLLCLGTTKDGAPLHPLMPSYDGHPLVPFAPKDHR